jgi:hypothetical protein
MTKSARLLAVLSTVVLALTTASAWSQDYKVGDRLPAAKAAAAKNATARNAPRTLVWDDLLPADWDPMAAFKGIDLNKLDDADPRATDALARMRKAWDAAPVNRSLDGQNVRIPGFIVSLDGGPDEIREFLLVPYFGACIHTPPPPANQIIHVMPDKPVKGIKNMAPAWVVGSLGVGQSDTPMGKSGYRLRAREVTPYKK